MSRLKPNYSDDEELKGSVDFDFFSNGSESARKNEDDPAPQRSGRSSGARSSDRQQKQRGSGGRRSPSAASSASSASSNRGPSPQRPQQLKEAAAAAASRPQPEESPRSASPARVRSRSPSGSRGSSVDDAAAAPAPGKVTAPAPGGRRRRGSASSTTSASSASASSSSSASDVTDVSPLSSPRPESPRRGGTASSGKPPHGSSRRDTHGAGGVAEAEERDEDRINMETIVRALVELDKRRCQSAGAQRSGLQGGTQSMSRIHDIEAENQRLLYSLMRTKSRKTKPSDIDPPAKRPHHSTVNRQKEQRRIEEENRKIFQRLKGVRPTKGMSREEMITDYKRQASFGLPLYMQGEEVKYRPPRITQNPYCQPISRVHSSSSMVHRGASSRPSSAASAGRSQSRASGSGGGGGGGGTSSGRPGWPSGW